MEERFNKQDKIIKVLIKETPLDMPSLEFSKKVMLQLHKKQERIIYKPLISNRAWGIIGTTFVVALVWLYFNPSSSMYVEKGFSFSDKLAFKNPFETITVSKTTLYAIGVMILFLFQIPFLKRMLEKKHS